MMNAKTRDHENVRFPLISLRTQVDSNQNYHAPGQADPNTYIGK